MLAVQTGALVPSHLMFLPSEIFSCSGFAWVPVTGPSVRTPRKRLTGLYFFLSSFFGLTEPSTNAVFSEAPSAYAIVATPSASESPSATAMRDLRITGSSYRKRAAEGHALTYISRVFLRGRDL